MSAATGVACWSPWTGWSTSTRARPDGAAARTARRPGTARSRDGRRQRQGKADNNGADKDGTDKDGRADDKPGPHRRGSRERRPCGERPAASTSRAKRGRIRHRQVQPSPAPARPGMPRRSAVAMPAWTGAMRHRGRFTALTRTDPPMWPGTARRRIRRAAQPAAGATREPGPPDAAVSTDGQAAPEGIGEGPDSPGASAPGRIQDWVPGCPVQSWRALFVPVVRTAEQRVGPTSREFFGVRDRAAVAGRKASVDDVLTVDTLAGKVGSSVTSTCSSSMMARSSAIRTCLVTTRSPPRSWAR